ncbi:MAG: NAD(P)H-dependent oxidoreductase [Planctomycetota bacterium]
MTNHLLSSRTVRKAKRVFIINGHPARESLSRALAESYANGAERAGHSVRITHVHDVHFDANFGQSSYRNAKPLEAGLERFIRDLRWSDHVVLVTPLWWGGLPAQLKGLLDRTLIPGVAFNPRKMRLGLPEPLLSGRSARVVVTSDTPRWWMRLAYKNALFWQLRRQVFGYVGIRPTRITHLSKASHAGPSVANRWIRNVAALGASAA